MSACKRPSGQIDANALRSTMDERVALGVAVDYALNRGLDAIFERNHFERNQHFARTLRRELDRLDGVTVHDQGRVRCGITTFSAEQTGAADLKAALREQNINVSVSPPSSTRLDAEARTLPDLVRASVHYYNTEEEIERFVAALRDAAKG